MTGSYGYHAKYLKYVQMEISNNIYFHILTSAEVHLGGMHKSCMYAVDNRLYESIIKQYT